MKSVYKQTAIVIVALLILAGCKNTFETPDRMGNFRLIIGRASSGRTILSTIVQSDL